MKQVSKSINETNQIAKSFIRDLAKNINSHDGALIIGLFGDLGAGKTAFTQAVAREIGIKSKVNSPTFVIMKKYSIPKQTRKDIDYKYFVHIDAYRLKNESELLHLGWDEIIKNKENIVFIEWSENVLKVMPLKFKSIFISHTQNGYREFRFK